jgi:hypothetical protein
MTKEEYKEYSRTKRIELSDVGLCIGQIMRGEFTPAYDNSHLWEIQKKIAKEIEPMIRKNQLAYINR